MTHLSSVLILERQCQFLIFFCNEYDLVQDLPLCSHEPVSRLLYRQQPSATLPVFPQGMHELLNTFHTTQELKESRTLNLTHSLAYVIQQLDSDVVSDPFRYGGNTERRSLPKGPIKVQNKNSSDFRFSLKFYKKIPTLKTQSRKEKRP